MLKAENKEEDVHV